MGGGVNVEPNSTPRPAMLIFSVAFTEIVSTGAALFWPWARGDPVLRRASTASFIANTIGTRRNIEFGLKFYF